MSKFVKVAKFTTLPEAQIAIGRLEAEGIPAFMADAYLAQILPGPFRIPVLVAAENEHAARRVLETDYSADLDEDDETT